MKPLLVFLITAALLFNGFAASPVTAQTQDCGSAYTVERGDTLSEIARDCGVSYSDLLEANPGIDNPQIIYPGQVINIPVADDGEDDNAIPVTGGSIYIVKPGDTLSRIASRFNVSVEALSNANPWLAQYDRVYPGMRLTLPRGASQVQTVSISPAVGGPDTTVTVAATGFQADIIVLVGFGRITGPYYQIDRVSTDANGAFVGEYGIPSWANAARGDYVFVVQNQNNPSSSALSNQFNLINVQPGGPIIPETGGTPVVTSYTVRSGDTLFEIAQMFNTTVDTLLDLNPDIEEASIIYPGQTIQLPQGTQPAGPFVTVSAETVSPGEEVTVRAFNFPNNAIVDIRLAPADGRYIQPYDARTNGRGRLTRTIRIPDSLEGGNYRIIVTTTERRTITRATSALFDIQD